MSTVDVCVWCVPNNINECCSTPNLDLTSDLLFNPNKKHVNWLNVKSLIGAIYWSSTTLSSFLTGLSEYISTEIKMNVSEVLVFGT